MIKPPTCLVRIDARYAAWLHAEALRYGRSTVEHTRQLIQRLEKTRARARAAIHPSAKILERTD